MNMYELLTSAAQKRLSVYALTKSAGTDNEEPSQETHSHSPSDKLRPRAEVIIYDKRGVYGINKRTYLLFPGGGIADGETAEATVVREAIEEADAIVKNLEPLSVISTVFDKDNIISEGWDGEKTHFYLGLYGGPANTKHSDRESFHIIPYEHAIKMLQRLIDDPRQAWAKQNNTVRLDAVKKASKMAKDAHTFLLKKYAALREMIRETS